MYKIKSALMVLLPVFTATFGLLYYTQPHPLTYAALVVLMTASIGFFTNWLAIKMLFHPREKTAFGNQGLLPKYQKPLAQKAGQQIQQTFFNSDYLLGYIQKQQFIPLLIDYLADSGKKRLQDPEQIRQLFATINGYIAQPEFQRRMDLVLRPQLLKLLQHFSHHQNLPGNTIHEWLNDFLPDSPHHPTIDKVINRVAEEVPEIAQAIDRSLTEHIENQQGIKRSFVKFLHWSSDIDQQDFKELLFRLLASNEFRLSIATALSQLISDMTQYMESTQGSQWLSEKLEILLKSVMQQSLPLLLNQLEQHLLEHADPASTTDSPSPIISSIDQVSSSLKAHCQSEAFFRSLAPWLEQCLHAFNVPHLIESQLSQLSAERFESQLMSIMGRHFAAIEIYGAIIGGLSGLALVNLPLFGMVLVLIFSVLALDTIATNYKNQTTKDP
ncbi:DUF445 family protein [Pleionea sp. CnH1-48]|uniref:DUF445 family protein n=1 Tax=Pleionea sp. CnH1-48 TaxID=2954494 RepID=UPI00209730D1|nr:DUF445 family protein [Pleionea sp. CnH1-48]MCO7226300.1 DUF445 domain-containing protein [Pleionea sp. CnH1-48]